MLSPILDIFRYIKMFQNYLGKKIYLIFALGLLAALSEAFGILMMIPLLETLDGSEVDPSDGIANNILYNIINFLGIQNSTLTILGVITVAFCMKGLIAFGAMSINAILMGSLLRKLKGKLFDHYTNMSFGYYSTKDTGHFTNLINEQPTKALEAFHQLTTLGGHLINTIVLMSLAFLITWQFGLMAIGVGILLLIIFVNLSSYVRSLSRITATENGVLTKWLIQTLHAFKYLAATGQTFVLKGSITKSIETLTKNQVGTGIAASFTQAVREPIAVIFIMSIVYVQIEIFDQALEPILVSIVLFYRALNSVLAVQSSFQGTFVHIGSMELVDEEFTNQRKNAVSHGEVEAEQFSQNIRFKDVSFSFGDELPNVLNNISINFPVNKSIALVGESGAGKSTLVDLITLLNKPQKGQILIDGIDSSVINKSSWRNQIGYVAQDTVIFDDTIANNISMWNSESKDSETLNEEIKIAARKANIYDFIISLEDGFNTLVGDRGVLLSGGQRQRLFIAREIYRKPNLLILDEATSALDSSAEREIQRSIDNLKGKTTVIIIAHRLSTIKNVDLIHVLKDGDSIENGTYEELTANPESAFYEFVSLQSLK